MRFLIREATRLFAFCVLALMPVVALSSTNSWSLASPKGRCLITVTLGSQGELSYQVYLDGKAALLPSPLGVNRDDESFALGLKLEDAGKAQARRERYELFSGPAPRVDHHLNYRSLVFFNSTQSRLVLDLAASDEGVAFRYRFPDRASGLHVLQTESTGFRLPRGTRGWLQPYHSAGPYTPAYEDFYFNVSPGDAPPQSRAKPLGWGFPALFHSGESGPWVLLSESGTDAAFCACHLGPDSAEGLYRVAFPATNEVTKGRVNHLGSEPRSELPWTLPWRVIVLGASAGDIATATLVTDLAPASRIADTSWIRPGRASWSWWAYPEGPATAECFNQYSDFAAKMGWEYTLFDAGWWKPGLKPIAEHARFVGVGPLAWCFAGDFYEPETRDKKLDEIASAGVSGVKVDFWCSDRQEAMAAMQGLFEAAARRHMVVNLHGCTVPRGWQRTWPNFLTAEAVLGAESYFYEPQYTQKAAELNAVLPFTRNAVGPMDLTPVACSPKKFARTTTAAHELAASIIFNSGIIHYADKPEFFESLPPEALSLLRDAPARWDETRWLVGEPGRLAVFARRAKGSWFIAGINGTGSSETVALDLSGFSRFHRRLLVAEGNSAQMEVSCAAVPVMTQWKHELPPRGGFILRLNTD